MYVLNSYVKHIEAHIVPDLINTSHKGLLAHLDKLAIFYRTKTLYAICLEALERAVFPESHKPFLICQETC